MEQVQSSSVQISSDRKHVLWDGYYIPIPAGHLLVRNGLPMVVFTIDGVATARFVSYEPLKDVYAPGRYYPEPVREFPEPGVPVWPASPVQGWNSCQSSPTRWFGMRKSWWIAIGLVFLVAGLIAQGAREKASSECHKRYQTEYAERGTINDIGEKAYCASFDAP